VKVTIDSTEPLEDAIRVRGALYGVTLTIAATEPATSLGTTSRDRRSTSPRPRKARTRSAKSTPLATPAARTVRGAKATAQAVDSAELRSWARQNGYTLSDRGRVPAAITAAYRDAHEI
jgi:hypothetical protein